MPKVNSSISRGIDDEEPKNYYFEMKENERQLKEDHITTIILSFILTALTVWLMVFGPRSILFGG